MMQSTGATTRRRRCRTGDPDAELEQKLRRDPGNEDAKVDVGSDESMDASDPPSSSQPGCATSRCPPMDFRPEARHRQGEMITALQDCDSARQVAPGRLSTCNRPQTGFNMNRGWVDG
jgi:hypothetical protein